MLKKYVIWNPLFAQASVIERNISVPLPSANTLNGLTAIEKMLGVSLSSVVFTHDINELIDSIHSETKIKLLHAELDSGLEKIQVAMYSLDLYNNFQDAKDNGAVTLLTSVYAYELKVVAQVFHMSQDSFSGKGRAIGTLINGDFTEM